MRASRSSPRHLWLEEIGMFPYQACIYDVDGLVTQVLNRPGNLGGMDLPYFMRGRSGGKG